jgi:hypothetical protein
MYNYAGEVHNAMEFGRSITILVEYSIFLRNKERFREGIQHLTRRVRYIIEKSSCFDRELLFLIHISVRVPASYRPELRVSGPKHEPKRAPSQPKHTFVGPCTGSL